jgi:hypothetical protein
MLCSRCQAAPALPQHPAHRCETCAEQVWVESVKWVVRLKAREAAKMPRVIHEPSAPDSPACVRVLFEDGRAYLCRLDSGEAGVRVTFGSHDLDPATDPHGLYFAARFVLDHGTKEEWSYFIVESKSRRTWVLSSATPLAHAYRFRTMREALEVLRELCADSRHLTSTRDRFDVLDQNGALVWTSGDQPMQAASPARSEIITEPAHLQSRDQTLALTIAPLGLREPSPQHGEAGGDLVQLRLDHTPAPHASAALSRLEACQWMRYLWDIYSHTPIKIERHPPDTERHRLGIASAATLSGLRVGGLGLRLDSRSGLDAILIPARTNPRRLWVVFHFGAANTPNNNQSSDPNHPPAQERWEVYEITSERALWLNVAEEPSA